MLSGVFAIHPLAVPPPPKKKKIARFCHFSSLIRRKFQRFEETAQRSSSSVKSGHRSGRDLRFGLCLVFVGLDSVQETIPLFQAFVGAKQRLSKVELRLLVDATFGHPHRFDPILSWAHVCEYKCKALNVASPVKVDLRFLRHCTRMDPLAGCNGVHFFICCKSYFNSRKSYFNSRKSFSNSRKSFFNSHKYFAPCKKKQTISKLCHGMQTSF